MILGESFSTLPVILFLFSTMNWNKKGDFLRPHNFECLFCKPYPYSPTFGVFNDNFTYKQKHYLQDYANLAYLLHFKGKFTENDTVICVRLSNLCYRVIHSQTLSNKDYSSFFIA